MDLSKVGYSFLIILALTLNFGFFWGEYNHLVDNHFSLLLTAAIVNTLCVYFIFKRNTKTNTNTNTNTNTKTKTKTKEKFAFKGRDISFATGLVASAQLWLTIVVWLLSAKFDFIEPSSTRILSLSGGALLANLITTCIVVLDTLNHKKNTTI